MAKVRFDLKISKELYEQLESNGCNKPKDISFLIENYDSLGKGTYDVVEQESATSFLLKQLNVVVLSEEVSSKRKKFKERRI